MQWQCPWIPAFAGGKQEHMRPRKRSPEAPVFAEMTAGMVRRRPLGVTVCVRSSRWQGWQPLRALFLAVDAFTAGTRS